MEKRTEILLKMQELMLTLIAALLISLAFIIIISGRVYAADDYPQKYKTPAVDTVIDEWNFYNRECTSFVAWCLNSRNGIAFTNQYGGVTRWGHAKDWADVARGLNIAVDGVPKPGAVAWSGEGKYGHVGWVAAVNGDNVKIEEYNYKNPVYNERTVNKNEFHYIHIKDLCTEHKWDKGTVTKKSKHTKTELVNGEKTYTCTVCGEKKTEVIKAAHTYSSGTVKKATLSANGSITKKCSKCGKKVTTVIPRPKKIRMKHSLVAYNGKAQKPGILVKDAAGRPVTGASYSVSYLNNVKIGKAKAIVRFRGKYSGARTLSFTIGPAGAAINKIAGGINKITIRWTRRSGIDGYQIQYATRKDFKDKKTITIKGNKLSTKAISGLRSGTTYYARVRTYRKIKKTTYHSPWSKTLSAKTAVVTERTKAMQAYKSFLTKNSYLESFALRDLNSDGLPELFTHGGGQIDYSKIHTYSKGSVTQVHSGSDISCYSNGIIRAAFNSGSGYWLASYYKLNNLKMDLVYRYAEWLYGYPETYSQGEDAYDEDSERVPYSEIQANLDTVLNGADIIELKYRSNTASNRTNYLK